MSGERGPNVTIIACVNAIGNAVPPMLIFPRVYFIETMLRGAPPGSISGANVSGWSTETLFSDYLDHFSKFVKPSHDHPVLIIMDNHETHISIEIIDKARDNGIVLLTLPPHTSHKMQPLDRCIFGPYKTFYNKAADNWILNHPGRHISIYEIAELVGEAYPKSFTQSNIIQGFKVTGICPLNSDIFSDEEFLSSYVTDRPRPPSADQNIELSVILNEIPETPGPSTSNVSQENYLIYQDHETEIARILENHHHSPVTPETVRPFQKAPPRKGTRGRKAGRTRILTDTPEK